MPNSFEGHLSPALINSPSEMRVYELTGLDEALGAGAFVFSPRLLNARSGNKETYGSLLQLSPEGDPADLGAYRA